MSHHVTDTIAEDSSQFEQIRSVHRDMHDCFSSVRSQREFNICQERYSNDLYRIPPYQDDIYRPINAYPISNNYQRTDYEHIENYVTYRYNQAYESKYPKQRNFRS